MAPRYAHMRTVCLTTDGHNLLNYASVEPFSSAPSAILWRDRIFTFVAWNGDLNRREKVAGCPDDVPVYSEADYMTVADGDAT